MALVFSTFSHCFSGLFVALVLSTFTLYFFPSAYYSFLHSPCLVPLRFSLASATNSLSVSLHLHPPFSSLASGPLYLRHLFLLLVNFCFYLLLSLSPSPSTTFHNTYTLYVWLPSGSIYLLSVQLVSSPTGTGFQIGSL